MREMVRNGNQSLPQLCRGHQSCCSSLSVLSEFAVSQLHWKRQCGDGAGLRPGLPNGLSALDPVRFRRNNVIIEPA